MDFDFTDDALEAFITGGISADAYLSTSGPCCTCERIVGVLSTMRDHIVSENKDGVEEEPVVLFSHLFGMASRQHGFFELKSTIAKYRTGYDYCQCIKQPKFHPGTGKSSVLVLALSLAYHTSNMCGVKTCHDDIVLQMENNYSNWANTIESKKPSVHRTTMIAKSKRYSAVLAYNRRMYTN